MQPHIIYPFICANNKIQLFFRELVVNKLIEDKTLEHLKLLNSVDDVVDKAVIERNSWLLYGSGKNDNINQLYKLTKIYDYNFNLLDLDEVDWFNLPSLLSIRKYKPEQHSDFIQGFSLEKINKLYEELIGQKTNGKSYTSMSDINKAKMLCSMLSTKRAKEYNSWIEVGFCLHNIDKILLEDWIQFSKKASGFKSGECEKLWGKFKNDGLSIGSLYRWAKEDDPQGYSDYLINELNDILKDNIKCSSFHVAKVFYELNKYNYVCCSVSKKKWFEYTNTFCTNVMNQCGLTFRDEKFEEKLDQNKYLIAFNNGVYDLKNNYFRNGRPEDYISMCTNCDYIPYDETNTKIKEVFDFFNKIQKNDEMREYLLIKLSTFLEGVQRDQKFEIWTGTGANGKGRILKLIIDALGDYACTIPITLLTKPRSDSNSASPALATTKGKRCCVFQEPENDDKIYVGHMKNITGGDKLMARSLYSDPVEFYHVINCLKYHQQMEEHGEELELFHLKLSLLIIQQNQTMNKK